MTSSVPRSICMAALLALPVAGCGSSHQQPQPASKPMVTAEDLEKSSGDPIVTALQAKVPGVIISAADDGGISIRIRGSTSFYGGNEPLFVVDELPFQPGPGGILVGINPHDIESIKVLKDPAETGIYGMRGANGVIVITMKKPPKRKG